MNWSELPKETKQVYGMCALIVFTIPFMIVKLAYEPATKKLKILNQGAKEYAEQLDAAERILPKDARKRTKLRELSQHITTTADEALPPSDSVFAWALAKIDDVGRKNDLFLQVGQQTRARYIEVPAKTTYRKVRETIPMWIPYTVKVTTQCGYGSMIRLLNDLQETFPYASICRVAITPSDDPETHILVFDVEWPQFRDNELRKELEELGSSRKKKPAEDAT